MTRVYLQDRDLLDLYLFRDFLLPESAKRLQQKMEMLHIHPDELSNLIGSLQKKRSVHLKNLDKIIDERVDKNMQSVIRMTGEGVVSIFNSVLEILNSLNGQFKKG